MTARRVVMLVLVLLPLLAAAGGALFLTGDRVRSYAADAVRRATGRELLVAGPVRLSWFPSPTLVMEGVSLANPPGLSRPALATLARVEAEVALWPLLQRRIEVRRLLLDAPDVLLERDAAGRPNWAFDRQAAPAPDTASDPAPAGPAAPASRWQVLLGTVRVRDGHLAWPAGGRVHRLDVPTLDATPDAAGTAINGALVLDGTAVALGGKAGPLSNAGGPWPLDLTLAARGLTLRAAGALGGNIALTGAADARTDLSALAGRPLPPFKDVRASAQFGPAGLSDMAAQANLDAGPLQVRVALLAPAMDQPITLTADGTAAGGPVTLAATFGSPAALLGPGPVPVKGQVAAAGATLAWDGAVDPRGAAWDGQVSARVPDLQALGALAGLRLPALRDVTLDAKAAPGPPGTLVLRGARLTMQGADLAGDLTVTATPRPAVRGTLVSQRMDLDALAAASAPAQPPRPSVPPPGSPTPTPATPPRALPDTPIPFEALRRGDADVQLSVAEATWRGTPFRAVSARLLLQDGKLRLDPASAQVPGGTATATLAADADAQTAALSMQAPGLAAGPILAAWTGLDSGAGTLDLDIALQGRGATLRALAASLDGHAGLALVDGEFDVGGILAGLGDALPRGLPLPRGGRSAVRCLALRVDAAAGQAALRTLLLDSARLHLTGEGTVNLVDETLDLHLRPQVRLGVGGVSVPVRVSGPLRAPRTQAEIAGGAGRPGLLIGAPPPEDDCAARLTEARGGRAGPMPAGAPEAPRPRPGDLLRNLLR